MNRFIFFKITSLCKTIFELIFFFEFINFFLFLEVIIKLLLGLFKFLAISNPMPYEDPVINIFFFFSFKNFL